MKATKAPSYRLTFDDAVKVWHMHWSGEIQSRIAARFDVNQGRVCEILKGDRHAGSDVVAKATMH